MHSSLDVRPILLLEMNEIPWRLIDRFVGEHAFPNLTRFFISTDTYTTRAMDVGELSPWITWPSLHRGMNNEQHGIKHLGQDPATFKGEPIWSEYRRHGLTIGICGSLQSWPPVDPGPGGFYIPDTFAHDERCIPAYVERFQRFNLGQVQKNGRVVNSYNMLSTETIKLALSLPTLGVRLQTAAMVLGQLMRERWDPTAVARRPIFQAILFWDLFRSLYSSRSPPAFATFFTNHVAGIMHRYWHDTFPQDFGPRYTERQPVHLATMRFALRVLDGMLADAMAYARDNKDLVVVFATSMGQGPIHRDYHEGVEATLPELTKLASVLGLRPSQYTPLMAMVPQVALELSDASTQRRIAHLLDEAFTASKAKLFRVDLAGASISITVLTPTRKDIEAGGFHFADRPDVLINWSDAGIQFVAVDPGTGYHVPEGILALHGAGIRARDHRSEIRATEVREFLLRLAGLSRGDDQRERRPQVSSSV